MWHKFILWGSAKVFLGATLRLSSSLAPHLLGRIGILQDLLLFEHQCVQSCSNICLSSFENVQLFCVTRGIQNRIGLRADLFTFLTHHTSVEKLNYWVCCLCLLQRKYIGPVSRAWRRGYVRIRQIHLQLSMQTALSNTSCMHFEYRKTPLCNEQRSWMKPSPLATQRTNGYMYSTLEIVRCCLRIQYAETFEFKTLSASSPAFEQERECGF